jgi:hypothetical protein
MAACSGLSCREKVAQISIEQRMALGLVYLLGPYETQHPGLELTNVSQLYANAGAGYPYPEGKLLRQFGTYAGFTNSIYEKYVFTSANARPKTAQGELILLNALPFPNGDGTLGRMAISKAAPGAGGYRIMWYSEHQVERIFREAGITIPKSRPMPSPPPEPPPDETSRKAAEALLDESYRVYPVPFWRRPAWQGAGVVVVLCAAIYGGFRLARRR